MYMRKKCSCICIHTYLRKIKDIIIRGGRGVGGRGRGQGGQGNWSGSQGGSGKRRGDGVRGGGGHEGSLSLIGGRPSSGTILW